MRALAVHQRRLEPAPRISLHGLNYGFLAALAGCALFWLGVAAVVRECLEKR